MVGLVTLTTGWARSTTPPGSAPSPEVVSPVVVSPAVGAIGTHTTGEVSTADGRTRTYRVYLPSALPAGPRPLILAFHGGGGSATHFELTSGFDGMAEANGVIVVYPDGVGTGPNETTIQTWNGGVCCPPAARKNVDDVSFVRLLIDSIESQYTIDPNRVYAAGHSNGAIFSYRLACELSDRIVAVGLQAGTLGIDNCAPARPVSLLHLHGAADANIPIDGGFGSESRADVDFPSPRESAKTIASLDGCPAQPEVHTDGANPAVEVTDWTPCTDGTEVRFLAVDGAPHRWMSGGPGPDAATEIVTFLLQHRRPD